MKKNYSCRKIFFGQKFGFYYVIIFQFFFGSENGLFLGRGLRGLSKEEDRLQKKLSFLISYLFWPKSLSKNINQKITNLQDEEVEPPQKIPHLEHPIPSPDEFSSRKSSASPPHSRGNPIMAIENLINSQNLEKKKTKWNGWNHGREFMFISVAKVQCHFLHLKKSCKWL